MKKYTSMEKCVSQKCPTFVPKVSQIQLLLSKCLGICRLFANFQTHSRNCQVISTSFFDAASNDLELGGFALQCLSQGLQPGCASVIFLRAAAVYDRLVFYLTNF